MGFSGLGITLVEGTNEIENRACQVYLNKALFSILFVVAARQPLNPQTNSTKVFAELFTKSDYKSFWFRFLQKAEESDKLKLLFANSNREYQVAGADIVNYVEAVNYFAEAGVYAVEVLCVLAVVADEELRATSVLAAVRH